MEQTAVGRKVGKALPKVDLDQMDRKAPEALRILGILEKVFYLEGQKQRKRLAAGTPVDEVRASITVKAGEYDATFGLYRDQTDHLEGICLLAAGLTQ
jgi:hypothetical protein